MDAPRERTVTAPDLSPAKDSLDESSVFRDAVDLASHLYCVAVFDEPVWLVDPPSWLEHIPFAFWLIDSLRPEILVEIGTPAGNSYAAFVQAAKASRLSTSCYSIDTSRSDRPVNGLDASVVTEWRSYHDRHFSSFSRLLNTNSSDAARRFAEGSIDLLHIDVPDLSTAVEQDFESWLPKMSPRGVVLLHDINGREPDSGIWRLWQRLEHVYPSFAFLHDGGLGVLGIGETLPPRIEWLLSRQTASPTQLGEVRQFFSQLGRRLSLQHACAQHERTIRELETEVRQQRDIHEQAAAELQDEILKRERAVRELESRLRLQRSYIERVANEFESRLEDERTQRERTIRELDAEASALATRLETHRQSAHGTGPLPAGHFESDSRAAPHSLMWRALAVLRAIPTVGRMAIESGSWRATVRTCALFAVHPRRVREAHLVAQSGLFDTSYYVTKNPDVIQSRLHPVVHYILWGATEGRRPHPLFDPAYYLQRYPDVARSGLEPLSHFLVHGAAEERSPGPYFDSRYYLANNPDVRNAGTNPLVHFVGHGWREGRSPSPSFDCAGYVARYEDVRASGINPLVHYAEIGCRENREASFGRHMPLPTSQRVRLTSQSLVDRQPDRSLILCLTHVCPWPPHAGNAYRIWRLLQQLQRDDFRILLVIAPLAGEDPDDASVRKVSEQFSNVVVVGRNGGIRYSLIDVPDVLASLHGEYTHRYSALLGEENPAAARERELLLVDRTYCHDAAIAVVTRLHSVLGQYMLLAEYIWMTRLLPLIDDRATKIVDTHDVYATKGEKVLRFGVDDLSLSPEEEADRLRRADVVIAIQDEERRVLERMLPDRRVVTAGIDFDVVGDAGLPAERRVLVVGSGNPMNVSGLQGFLRFAWPAVQRLVPDAELMVAGAISQGMTADEPRVRALGRVDDLGELYRSARVVINPVVAGTGIKIKTVEALSRLRPIVTWPTGVEGLPPGLRSLCDVVEDWYRFGERVANHLMTDRHESFSTAECRLIIEATSAKAVYAELSHVLRELSGNGACTPRGSRSTGPS